MVTTSDAPADGLRGGLVSVRNQFVMWALQTELGSPRDPAHSLGGWYSSLNGLLYLRVIAGPPCLNQHPPLLAEVD